MLLDPRRSAALGLGLALMGGGCDSGAPTSQAPEPAPQAPPPNLLLITIDTLRADALGAYGQELPSSPNLDKLASQGVLFEHCTASVPSTLPSHSSIMTGKQPYAHGVRSNAGYVLTADNVTLAEVLRGYGYRTAAEIAAPVIGRRTFLNQGFERYRDLESLDIERLSVMVEGEPRELVERSASDITKHGLAFLESVGDEPFFLWLHYFDVHAFYNPPQPYADLIPQSRYHAELRYVDDQIGRVMRALHRSGLQDRTLVVVTSDHGEGLGEHGEATHVFFVYDTTIRVPLIFWAPGRIPQGRRVPALVRTVDIAPTLLDLLELPPLTRIQGTSLRPLLEGQTRDLGLLSYAESLEPLQLFDSSVLRSVREGRWKYIHKLRPELYEIPSDPGELENLAESRPEIVERLQGRLRGLLEAAPPVEQSAVSDVDPVTQAHLQALGYVAVAPPQELDELASLEVSSPDPGDLADDVRAHARALGMKKTGQLEAASRAFRELWERHPTAAPVLSGLVETLELLERTEELRPLLEKGVALGSGNLGFHVKLAELRFEDGAREEAFLLLTDALDRRPCAVVPRVTFSNLLQRAGHHARQIEVLEEGVARCPDATDLQNDLAFALAVIPDDSLRDGPRALELAREVIRQAEGNPAYLDTLACAQAETGDFEGARRSARRAVSLVEQAGMPDSVVQSFREHLEAFEAGRPWRKRPQSG